MTLSEEGYWGPNWECRVRDAFHYCGSGVGIGSILHDGSVTGCPSVSRRLIEGNSARDAVHGHLGRGVSPGSARAGASLRPPPAGNAATGICAKAAAAICSTRPTPPPSRAA